MAKTVEPRPVLISYFENGKLPKGENFASLIESMVHQDEFSEWTQKGKLDLGAGDSKWSLRVEKDNLVIERVTENNANGDTGLGQAGETATPSTPPEIHMAGYVATEGRIGTYDPPGAEGEKQTITADGKWKQILSDSKSSYALEIVAQMNKESSAERANVFSTIRQWIGFMPSGNALTHAIALSAPASSSPSVRQTGDPDATQWRRRARRWLIFLALLFVVAAKTAIGFSALSGWQGEKLSNAEQISEAEKKAEKFLTAEKILKAEKIEVGFSVSANRKQAKTELDEIAAVLAVAIEDLKDDILITNIKKGNPKDYPIYNKIRKEMNLGKNKDPLNLKTQIDNCKKAKRAEGEKFAIENCKFEIKSEIEKEKGLRYLVEEFRKNDVERGEKHKTTDFSILSQDISRISRIRYEYLLKRINLSLDDFILENHYSIIGFFIILFIWIVLRMTACYHAYRRGIEIKWKRKPKSWFVGPAEYALFVRGGNSRTAGLNIRYHVTKLWG